MRAIKNILAGFAIALLILGGTAFASQADSSALYDNATMILPEEEYVNDIPFSTEKVFQLLQANKQLLTILK